MTIQTQTHANNQQHTDIQHSGVFELLIENQSVTGLKSIHITPIGENNIEFRALLRIEADRRWHWLADAMSNPADAMMIADTLIDFHQHFHPEDHEEMCRWRMALSHPELYTTQGVSVYSGAT